MLNPWKRRYINLPLIYDDNLLQIIHTVLFKKLLFGGLLDITILHHMFFSFTKSQFFQVYLLRQTGKKVSTLYYTVITVYCLKSVKIF